jgi:hypothetical protein
MLHMDLNLRKKLAIFYNWTIVLCGTENWTLRKVNQKYLESFVTYCEKKVSIAWSQGGKECPTYNKKKEG